MFSATLFNHNRPFAQLLPGLETGHPVTVGQSPAYDFSVSDEQKAVFLVSLSDCSECDSCAGDWPTVTGCPVSNPGNNCANGLCWKRFLTKVQIFGKEKCKTLRQLQRFGKESAKLFANFSATKVTSLPSVPPPPPALLSLSLPLCLSFTECTSRTI